MDFVRSEVANGGGTTISPAYVAKKHQKPGTLFHDHKKKLLIIAVVGIVIGVGSGVLIWKMAFLQPANANPFTAKELAAVQFPLYYPTQLPTGYRIDTKSVNMPQSGVVVFDMSGPNGKKIYMSEEARPSTFDLGGFYKKFEDLKEIPVSDGSVAVGKLGGGTTEIVSRANNKTWILSNTTANIPLDQLVAMMKSLSNSF